MFWGVILESGKRYSQKVAESYHLSMASLEPLQSGIRPPNKEVSVMIEHGESEYLLCTLEYGRVMQINLDIIFDCGEVVSYFLNGEGTVHLTGYALAETEENDVKLGTHKPNKETALTAEDEEDKDWIPSKRDTEDTEESEDSDDDDDDDSDLEELDTEEAQPKRESKTFQKQLSVSDAEEKVNDARKRKNITTKGDKTKRLAVGEEAPFQNGFTKDCKIGQTNKRSLDNQVNDEDSDDNTTEDEDSGNELDPEQDGNEGSEDDSSSVDCSSNEDKQKPVSGTPVPKKKGTSFGESPNLSHVLKNKQQKQKKSKSSILSSVNQETVLVSKNARKLLGNVQVEDIRIGSGPPAKKGKFVFLHYVGKLLNGKVFETCEAPKKPFSFRLGKGEIIKGLEIGVEGMKVGGKRRIIIPPHMGYGNKKVEVIPSNSTLIFTVELKSVS